MKIFEMREKAIQSKKGECLVGLRETGSHACYMIYGILKPREKQRLMKPGPGHEEILLAMKGDLEITGEDSVNLKEGFAFHLQGDRECFLRNAGDVEAIYIIAGGHSDIAQHQQ